jgi:hypothetical protein
MAASLAVLASAPIRLAAQGKAEFIPFVGLYLPTGKVVDESGVSLKHNTAFVFGLRLAMQVADRVGVEGSFGYTPSAVTFSAGGGSADTSAHVLLASARVRFGVGPRTGSTAWHALAGLSVVAHGGNAYSLLQSLGGSLSGATDIGMVVGIGGKFKVGPSLAVRVDVEDNLYSAKFSLGGANSQSKFQNDIVASMGLVVRLGGK